MSFIDTSQKQKLIIDQKFNRFLNSDAVPRNKFSNPLNLFDDNNHIDKSMRQKVTQHLKRVSSAKAYEAAGQNTSTQQSIKLKAYKYIASKRMATLATVGANYKPDAALVHIVIHKDFSIYFTGRLNSRKITNLTLNPKVAMSITDEANLSTIQLCGFALIIKDLEKEQSIIQELWQLRFRDSVWPIPTVKLLNDGLANRIAIVKVTPTEMIYADFIPQMNGKFKSNFQTII